MNRDALEKWADNIEKVSLYIIMVLGVIMLVVAWAHIFYRYVLNNSLSWSEEFLKLCLVWFCLLSSSILSKRKQHVGIVIFREKMPKKVQHVLVNFVTVLMIIAAAIVAIIGINLVMKSTAQRTPALQISLIYCYGAIPVSFTLMFIYNVFHLLQEFLPSQKPSADESPAISK